VRNLVFHSQGSTKLDYSWNGRYNGALQQQDVYVWGIHLSTCPSNIVSGSLGAGVDHGDVTLFH
jgi:hypothetical protein